MYAALAAGASGFLLKDVSPEHLVAAVRLVRTGDALLAPVHHPPAGRALRPRVPAAPPHARLSELTPRELEVLGLLARGLSNTELAAPHPEQGDGQDTRCRILAKLGLRDRVQAVVLAYETGLVTRQTSETGA